MEGVQGNLCRSVKQRCEMTIKPSVFDCSEHGILPWQIKSEFTYTKVFLSFHKGFVGSALQARDLGDEPGELLRWRDFDIETWG